MKLRVLIYATTCVAALAYLVVANAMGYAPFSEPTSTTIDRTPNHFHK